jgi:hypothetical protein
MLKTVVTIGGGTSGLTYKGTWNASANLPALASGVGTNGDYYVVSTAGSTNLDGITDWQIGDWAIFNGTAWQKIDQTNSVSSVNGQTGAVVLNAANVGAAANTVNVIAGGLLAGGGALTGNVTLSLTSVPVANVVGAVANTVEIIAGVGLDGGGALTGNVTVDLGNTAVAAGNYGNSSSVGTFTVDAQGRLTAASNATIVATQVNLSNTSASATFATSSLPLVPEGYITIKVAGVDKKVPYYGV